MTLLELAKQYESDVENRINCIKTERRYSLDPHYTTDCNEQIGHWEATLRQIRKVITDNETH